MPRTKPPVETRDVVVIGGGPAGLAAALGAKRAGVGDVLVVERDPRLGGILNQCVHDGFGLFLYKETISGPEYAERLAEDVVREGIALKTGTMVLDLGPDRLLRPQRPGRIPADPGRRGGSGHGLPRADAGDDRDPRDAAGGRSGRPAAPRTWSTSRTSASDGEAVILGSGDIGLIMARRLTFEGIKVKGVFELLPWPGGLERNVRQCLKDFGIPLELSRTVVEIRGRERLSAWSWPGSTADLKPVAGTEEAVRCDTLLLSVGLIPENELSKRAGIDLSPLTGGAVVDETLMTSREGVFSCGNVLHIHDVADWASFEGFAAGRNAAAYALGRRTAAEVVRVTAAGNIRYVLPQAMRRGAAAAALFRVVRPVRGLKVEARGATSGKIYGRRIFARAVPSEMQKIVLRAGRGGHRGGGS